EQMRRRDLGARLVPGAPFVDHQLHPPATIELAHDVPVAGDQAFHFVGLVEQLVPLVRRELYRVAFAGIPVGGGTAADVPGIVMQRPAPETAQLPFTFFQQRGEEFARPTEVAGVRSRSHKLQLRTIFGYPGRETSELGGVFLRREIAAAAPGFVAYTPVA